MVALAWEMTMPAYHPPASLLFVLFSSLGGVFYNTVQKSSDKLTATGSFLGSLWGEDRAVRAWHVYP